MEQAGIKKIIISQSAPAPIGPYSQGVFYGDLLFVSGQIPIDPATGELVSGNIADETRQVMKNLRGILEEAGLTFGHVIKSTIYLSSMGDFSEVNEVYGQFFDETDAPARETVEVAGLPKGVNIEISVIAGR